MIIPFWILFLFPISNNAYKFINKSCKHFELDSPPDEVVSLCENHAVRPTGHMSLKLLNLRKIKKDAKKYKILNDLVRSTKNLTFFRTSISRNK